MTGYQLRSDPSFADFLRRKNAWSLMTFGEGYRWKALLAHIQKELAEVAADPTCLEEWVDVILLALDGAFRAGYDEQEIVAAMFAKQDKNYARTWPKPVGEDTPIEHCKDADEERYYLVSFKHGFVGNCMQFWGDKCHGYTCRVKDAGLYTAAEALRHATESPGEIFPIHESWARDHASLVLDGSASLLRDVSAIVLDSLRKAYHAG